MSEVMLLESFFLSSIFSTGSNVVGIIFIFDIIESSTLERDGQMGSVVAKFMETGSSHRSTRNLLPLRFSTRGQGWGGRGGKMYKKPY